MYAAALNFKSTLKALKRDLHREPYQRPPKAPVLYIKPRNTWSVHGASIPCPSEVDQLRMGGTLGIVIGRTACRIAERDALDYIAGYALVNDVSIPHSSFYRPAIRERCRDGFCPIGPMAGRGALPSISAVEIRIFVNGELLCVSNTRHLVRSAPRLLSDVTEFMTLNPGDMLLAGEPDNAPLAAPGDRVRVEADGLKYLDNTIRRSSEVENRREA